MDEYDAQVLLFAEIAAAETGATREAEEEEETKKGGGGEEEGKEVNEEFAKDTRGAMAAIGASCLWTSTIPSSNSIDDNDSLLTKRRYEP